MKAEEAPLREDEASPVAFLPFAFRVVVIDRDQLIALLMAAGRMTNGHGLQLYDLLKAKAVRFGIEV